MQIIYCLKWFNNYKGRILKFFIATIVLFWKNMKK